MRASTIKLHFDMALYIRDPRASRLAKQLAARKKTTVTRAVTEALELELARQAAPLSERIAGIARDAARLKLRRRGRAVTKRKIDGLWGGVCSKSSVAHD
jgi:antitoxin VapB